MFLNTNTHLPFTQIRSLRTSNHIDDYIDMRRTCARKRFGIIDLVSYNTFMFFLRHSLSINLNNINNVEII